MVAGRIRIALVALIACGFAAFAGVVLAQRGDQQAAAARTPGEFQGGIRGPVPAPDLAGLRDQDGRPVDMASLRGRPIVVTFVYSTCEDTCPDLMRTTRAALDRVGEDVPVLAISVDPAQDTPRSARRFLLENGMTGRARYMLGSRDALEAAWKGYFVQHQTDDLEHSGYVVLVDGEGRQRVGWPVGYLAPDPLADDIRLLLQESRRASAAAANVS